jgi:predicted metal-binding protein
MDKAKIEEQLCLLPLAQYAWAKASDLTFSERIREVCRQECPMYNKSWACPPAVGTVEECRARCLGFSEALVITTVTEVRDIADLEETLATREPHEEVTRQVRDLLRQEAAEVLVLSTEACAVCERCAWLDGEPCRHPERMFPCVESYGVVATDLAERYGIEFYGGNIVTWFSVLLFR